MLKLSQADSDKLCAWVVIIVGGLSLIAVLAGSIR
jgi:hypothetical protein